MAVIPYRVCDFSIEGIPLITRFKTKIYNSGTA